MKPSTFFAFGALFFLLNGALFTQSNFGPAAFSSFEIVAGGGEGYRQLAGREIFFRNENEVPGSSWMAGVKTSRRISNRLWVGLGVNFTNVGYRTQTEESAGLNICSTPVFGGVVIPDLGDVFIRVPNVGLLITPTTRNDCFRNSDEQGQERQILFNTQQVEVPLTVRYEVDKFRFRPFIEAGLTGSYMVRNSVREKRGSEVVKAARQQLEDRERFSLGLILSVGASYGFNENYSVFVQPVYRYSFSPTGLTSDSHMSEYSRSLMVQVGIRKDVY